MNQKRTILLIDNDQRSSYIISLILKLNDYDVDYHADPKPVLSYLHNRMYDLILLNLTSIKTNYLELYNQIRSKDAQVKICFITDNRFHNKTHDDEKFVQQLKRDNLTSCDFVDKPVNTNQILDIVVSHLE